MVMTLEDLKNWATIIGVIVTIFVFFKGILEYSHQNAMRRLELFQSMRKRFEESAPIQRVREALESEKEDSLAALSKKDKVDFLAFYEDLALMVDSGLMRSEIAQYWFSFYILMANDEQGFWADLDANLPYWKVVRQFATDMQRAEEKMARQNQAKFQI